MLNFVEKQMLRRKVTGWFGSLLLCAAIAGVGAGAQARPAGSSSVVSFATVTGATPLPNGIELHDGALIMQITALRDDVLRVRASGTGVLPEDASWAVLAAARGASVGVSQDEDAKAVGFHTAGLRVSIERTTGLMTLTDASGKVLRQDAEPMLFDGKGFRLAETMPADEHYFGLGDKTGAFDHRAAAFRLWNTDAYGWQESTDPLYKSIPFYVSYCAGISLGVLIDNTWTSSFDFGK